MIARASEVPISARFLRKPYPSDVAGKRYPPAHDRDVES